MKKPHRQKGSLTAELALLFPVLFGVLLMIFEMALFCGLMVRGVSAVEGGILILRSHEPMRQRRNGRADDGARYEKAESFLSEELQGRASESYEHELSSAGSLFGKTARIRADVLSRFFSPLDFSLEEQAVLIDAARFKNRVDHIFEKGKSWLHEN